MLFVEVQKYKTKPMLEYVINLLRKKKCSFLLAIIHIKDEKR